MSAFIRPEHWRTLIANAATDDELFALACMTASELLSLYRSLPDADAYEPQWTFADYLRLS